MSTGHFCLKFFLILMFSFEINYIRIFRRSSEPRISCLQLHAKFFFFIFHKLFFLCFNKVLRFNIHFEINGHFSLNSSPDIRFVLFIDFNLNPRKIIFDLQFCKRHIKCLENSWFYCIFYRQNLFLVVYHIIFQMHSMYLLRIIFSHQK